MCDPAATGAETCYASEGNNGFALLVVLFILLIIVGAIICY
ncbi:MAG: YjcZ family sporulation protein [Sporolactobacillus sp.]